MLPIRISKLRLSSKSFLGNGWGCLEQCLRGGQKSLLEIIRHQRVENDLGSVSMNSATARYQVVGLALQQVRPCLPISWIYHSLTWQKIAAWYQKIAAWYQIILSRTLQVSILRTPVWSSLRYWLQYTPGIWTLTMIATKTCSAFPSQCNTKPGQESLTLVVSTSEPCWYQKIPSKLSCNSQNCVCRPAIPSPCSTYYSPHTW